MVGAAESVAAELEHAQQRVDQLTTGRTRLTVATFTSGGRLLLPGALARLTAAHPGAVLHIREGEPETTLPLVRQGAVDLALAYHFDGPLPVGPGPSSGLEWTHIVEDPLHVVLPQEHRLAGSEVLDLAELAAEPWVLGCLKTEAYLRRYAERAGFDPEVRGTTTDYFFARTLVAMRLGDLADPLHRTRPGDPGPAHRSGQAAGAGPAHRCRRDRPWRPAPRHDPHPSPP